MSDEEIIHAAARALLSATDGCTCIADDFTDDECLFHRVKVVQFAMAHSVIRVVEPLIREQIANEIAELQHAQCGYGTREGDGRTCDCKFGGLVNAWEVTGCAEYRTAARIARGDHRD